MNENFKGFSTIWNLSLIVLLQHGHLQTYRTYTLEDEIGESLSACGLTQVSFQPEILRNESTICQRIYFPTVSTRRLLHNFPDVVDPWYSYYIPSERFFRNVWKTNRQAIVCHRLDEYRYCGKYGEVQISSEVFSWTPIMIAGAVNETSETCIVKMTSIPEKTNVGTRDRPDRECT